MKPGRPLAATIACTMLITACGASGTSPTTSNIDSATPSDAQSPTSSPSEEPSSPTAAPTGSDPSDTSWRMTASFDSDPGTSIATDVAAWSGGFVAIGTTWESEFRTDFGMPAAWTSGDGESWEALPLALGVDGVALVGIAPIGDGELLLTGNLLAGDAYPERLEPSSVAWISEDALTWQPVDLPVDIPMDSFDHGPKGYALTANGGLWFSADGTDWAMTYDGAAGVVAGDEGFAAMIIPEAAGPSSVVASGDGQTWYESDHIGSPLLDVAALGGDWVAVGASSDPISSFIYSVMRSANGLDWAPGLEDVNDLTGLDGPKTGRGLNELAINGASLAGGPGYAFLTLTNNHCCAQMSWNYGVWVSADGVTWDLAVEGDAFVSSVASDGDTTVLAGHLRRGEDAAFWIGGP